MRILLLIFVLIGGRALAHECAQDARDSLQGVNISHVTWIGRMVAPYLPKEAELLDIEEKVFLLNHPQALLAIKSASCSAMILSLAVCDVKLDKHVQEAIADDETDALRHFLFSSFLTCSQGANFTRAFTTLHEGSDVEKWHDSSVMDYKNNQAGINWASHELRRCQTATGDKDFVRGGLDLLMAKKLVTLRKGTSKCATPREITDKDLEALNEKIKKTKAEMIKRPPVDFVTKLFHSCK